MKKSKDTNKKDMNKWFRNNKNVVKLPLIDEFFELDGKDDDTAFSEYDVEQELIKRGKRRKELEERGIKFVGAPKK